MLTRVELSERPAHACGQGDSSFLLKLRNGDYRRSASRRAP